VACFKISRLDKLNRAGFEIMCTQCMQFILKLTESYQLKNEKVWIVYLAIKVKIGHFPAIKTSMI